jgi:hypothetical protein
VYSKVRPCAISFVASHSSELALSWKCTENPVTVPSNG